ncbi:unnamed protein product [Cuscuta campestris]|uniref:YDG domain-containing protein n=1 Tax=Cuscuta campestris TaxID=132261 RepID=A0A484NAT3_9ASTE|nr:unnamed protein product [Cuscuta campestris]
MKVPQNGNVGVKKRRSTEPPTPAKEVPTNSDCKTPQKSVTETIHLFNKLYLKTIQKEETRLKMKEKPKKAAGEDEKKRSFRLDLKVLSQMKENNETIETPNSFGNIPGVEVGHHFFSRCEMTVIGFHNHWLNGIDYVGNSKAKEFKGYRLPLTRFIVLSGQYEDDQDNYDEVVYTG